MTAIALPALESDLPDILALTHRAYAANRDIGFHFYGSREKLEDLEEPFRAGHIWKRLDAGRIVASVRLDPRAQRCLYVSRLCVEPTLQNRGLGRLMMRFAEEEAKRRGLKSLKLDTAKPFEKLVTWYQRLGFVVVDETQWDVTNYRSVIMEKVL